MAGQSYLVDQARARKDRWLRTPAGRAWQKKSDLSAALFRITKHGAFKDESITKEMTAMKSLHLAARNATVLIHAQKSIDEVIENDRNIFRKHF